MEAVQVFNLQTKECIDILKLQNNYDAFSSKDFSRELCFVDDYHIVTSTHNSLLCWTLPSRRNGTSHYRTFPREANACSPREFVRTENDETFYLEFSTRELWIKLLNIHDMSVSTKLEMGSITQGFYRFSDVTIGGVYRANKCNWLRLSVSGPKLIRSRMGWRGGRGERGGELLTKTYVLNLVTNQMQVLSCPQPTLHQVPECPKMFYSLTSHPTNQRARYVKVWNLDERGRFSEVNSFRVKGAVDFRLVSRTHAVTREIESFSEFILRCYCMKSGRCDRSLLSANGIRVSPTRNELIHVKSHSIKVFCLKELSI